MEVSGGGEEIGWRVDSTAGAAAIAVDECTGMPAGDDGGGSGAACIVLGCAASGA